jgi:Lrp/AsnC family transcriptional regulator, leucine-responsive regulatory protein
VPKSGFDEIDRKILMLMQSDGRISLSDLSGKSESVAVALSSPHPPARARGCRRALRCRTRSNQSRTPVSVFVSIKLESQRVEALERFKRAIEKWPEMLECYLMTGPRDYLLRIVAADLGAYERFLKQKLTRIDGIASIDSGFALEQTKYSNVLPVA